MPLTSLAQSHRPDAPERYGQMHKAGKGSCVESVHIKPESLQPRSDIVGRPVNIWKTACPAGGFWLRLSDYGLVNGCRKRHGEDHMQRNVMLLQAQRERSITSFKH
jgi:hypothetical protein